MTEGTGSSSSGPNMVIVTVVALVIVAGVSIWAMTQHRTVEKHDGTTISGSATVGDKDADVKVKVNLPDSVTIDAR